MVDQRFLGTLKKYETVRIDDEIQVKVLIKHSDEGSVQTFLNSFSKKLGIDNVESLFTYPVRWKKMVLDTSDFIQRTYTITFGEVEFIANLQEISIAHKLNQGSELFDYSLHFTKEASTDLLDKLVAEAYLDYKEENDDGKKVIVEFDVSLELMEGVKQQTEEQKIF